MTTARAVLYLLALVLPVALWTGSTAYDQAKFLLWALAAAAWLALAARAVARGQGSGRLPRGLVAAGVTMLAVQAPALGQALSPHLVGRALLWSALWWLVVIVVTVVVREDRQRQRLVCYAVVGAAATCAVALLQMAGVAPAPADWNVPIGIGTLGNENAVAELAACWLLPSLLLPLATRGPARRALAVLPALVMLAMLAASQAAGARASALAAVVFAVTGEALLRSRRPDRTPLVLGALVAAGALVAGVLVEQVQTGGSLVTGGNTLPARVLAANHGAERRADWLVARELWRLHSGTGCGAGNYGVAWLRTRADLAAAGGFPAPVGGAPVATRAHNEYLQWAAETGWAGVVWLVAIILAGAAAWARNWRGAPTRAARRALLLSAAGLVALAVAALVGFPAHLPASGFAMALLVGLILPMPHQASGRAHCPRWCALPLLAAGLLLAGGALRAFHGDLLLARGSHLFTAGAMQESIKPFRAGLARAPWPGTARLELGLALAATGDFEAAGSALEASLRDRPSFEAPLALAELELDAGQAARAAVRLEMVERCSPPLPQRRQVSYLRAYARLRAGDPAAARDGFASLVTQDPLDHRAWLGLGYALDLMEERASAVAAYRQAVSAIETTLAAPRPATAVARGEIARLRTHLAVARRALASVSDPPPTAP